MKPKTTGDHEKLLNLTVMERQYLEEVMVQLEQADDLEV